jgi:hypothetical protein
MFISRPKYGYCQTDTSSSPDSAARDSPIVKWMERFFPGLTRRGRLLWTKDLLEQTEAIVRNLYRLPNRGFLVEGSDYFDSDGNSIPWLALISLQGKVMWKRAVRVFEGEELAFIWPLRNGGFLAGTISNDHQGRGLNTAVVNKDGIVIRHRNASKGPYCKILALPPHHGDTSIRILGQGCSEAGGQLFEGKLAEDGLLLSPLIELPKTQLILEDVMQLSSQDLRVLGTTPNADTGITPTELLNVLTKR